MEYEINKGVSKTELVLKLKDIAALDEFRYRMIKENAIAGIVPFVRGKLNEVTVYTYDITGMQSAGMRFEGKRFKKEDIQKLYVDVISVVLKSEDYFLDKNCFLLSEELIQYDGASGSYQLLYCPEYKSEMKHQLADVTEYVLNHTDYSDKQAVTMIYEIFRMMRDGHTTMLEVLTYVREGRKQTKVRKNEQMQAQSYASYMGEMPEKPFHAAEPVRPMQQADMQGQKNLAVNPFEKKEDAGEDGGFSTKKALLCLGAVAAGTGLFLALYLSGILFVSHTKKLDFSKFGGLIVLVGGMVLYACYKIYGMEEKEQETCMTKEKKKGEKEPKHPAERKPDKRKPDKKTPNVKKTTDQNMPQQNQWMPQQDILQQRMPKPLAVPQQPERLQKAAYEAKYQQMPPKKKSFYRLVAEKETNAQQFVLYKTPYLLGKANGQVDGVIFSDAVSKVHAEFIEEQGRLYIVDMSSTNGTYVNKKKIASNQRIAVGKGDRIRLADREFLLCS